MKGVWTHAIGSFRLAWVVGALTFGLATFVIGMIYAIMNKNIVRNYGNYGDTLFNWVATSWYIAKLISVSPQLNTYACINHAFAEWVKL